MTSEGLHGFCEWLGRTGPAQMIQDAGWMIPTSQAIHILAVSVVMSSIVVLDLRILGVLARGQTVAAVAERFLPWLWPALAVLLLTGTLQIVAEPARSLENPAFQLKMLLLLAALALTLTAQQPLRRGAVPGAARAAAVLSLLLWVGIACAGRWIAYMQAA